MDGIARLTLSYGRAINDLYPSMSCEMLVVQWRSVCPLKMPKLLLIDLDFSWISSWIAAYLPHEGAW